MRFIAIIVVLVFLLPIVVAQPTCIDSICAIELQVWDVSDCFEQICVYGLGVSEVASCYTSLCRQDSGSLDSSCQAELCSAAGSDTTPDTTPGDGDTTVPLTGASDSQAQIDDLNNQINSLQREIVALNTEIDSLKSSKEVPGEEFPSPKIGFSLLYIVLAVVALGLITFGAVDIVRLKKAMLGPKEKKQIKSYIDTYTGQGYQFSSIKQGLLNQGWTKGQIEEAHKSK